MSVTLCSGALPGIDDVEIEVLEINDITGGELDVGTRDGVIERQTRPAGHRPRAWPHLPHSPEGLGPHG